MKIPGKATISNRTSTMASQFARARAPYVKPTLEQFEQRYRMLMIDPKKPQCAYCGGPPSEWDHLFPMVSASQWTGYFTEIANLVPACGKCNQSRGSKPFATWMRSSAVWSPYLMSQSRDGLSPVAAAEEVDRRVRIIENAIEADPPAKVAISWDDDERELEALRLELNELLYKAEAVASRLRSKYRPQ